MRTHYDNLKVAEDAPDEVIKAAYRALSQKYHPDKHGGDAEAQRIMQIINAAYAVLSDPAQRSRYDESLRQRRHRGAADGTRTTSPRNDVPPGKKADPPPAADPHGAPRTEARWNSTRVDTANGTRHHSDHRRTAAWVIGVIVCIGLVQIIRKGMSAGGTKSDPPTSPIVGANSPSRPKSISPAFASKAASSTDSPGSAVVSKAASSSNPLGPAHASSAAPFTNSLGLEFVPAGTPGLLFARTETRVRDFRAFASANRSFAASQKSMEGFTLESDHDRGYAWKLAGGHWEDPHFEQGPNHPVVCVSQIDAAAFCIWLTAEDRVKRLIGRRDVYRLPTDEEWSAAAGTGKYPWGETFPPPGGAANLCGSESKTGPAAVPQWTVIQDFSDGFPRTAPVGQFKENRFGLFDMLGNVSEICSSAYRKSMNSAEIRKEFPFLEREKSPNGTAYFALRGGSWFSSVPTNLLVSYRDRVAPTGRDSVSGFRVVLVVEGGG